ncbi:uncharacterized protein LOC129793718 [Lutzomyia longipalpis]|uniref:uncharacterized protein LOC129793718 n=1 Tax=Lutzomyia longipalpis TaxID=7200 RepID=UPI0024835259|nr:uncharacterized protein LOC129793718 [Lutzomyia longipalpis]
MLSAARVKSEKNPIMLLKELCDKHKFLHPKYEDCSTEFDDRYVYSCEAFGTKVKASAPTAREAKINAAKEVLDTVRDRFKLDLKVEDPVLDPRGFYNYVGALNEECVKKKLQQPLYQVKPVPNKKKESIFEAICQLGNLSISQKSTSKQAAKHAAAKAMIEHLSEVQVAEMFPVKNETHKFVACFNPDHLESAKKLLENSTMCADKKALVEDVCRTLGIPSQSLLFADNGEDLELFCMNITFASSFCGKRQKVYTDVVKHLREIINADVEEEAAS